MRFVRYVSCDNVLREFGSRVLALRLARNQSRRQVAGAADIRVRHLTLFERGERSLEFIEFVRLCLVLGLRERVPEWVPEPPISQGARTRRGPKPRLRASKREVSDPDPDEDPVGYWAAVRWIWEP